MGPPEAQVERLLVIGDVEGGPSGPDPASYLGPLRVALLPRIAWNVGRVFHRGCKIPDGFACNFGSEAVVGNIIRDYRFCSTAMVAAGSVLRRVVLVDTV